MIKRFRELNEKDASGGKGASLGELTKAGIPVPDGFVITADVFDRFVEGLTTEIDAALDSVNHEEMHSVENASEVIQALILAQKMPKDLAKDITAAFRELGAEYVAVRSSATEEDSKGAAWAGQLDSFLNTTEASLLANVQKCWASLFTPRAIFYRFEKGFGKKHISVAVVIQKMIQSDVSGIGFSVHPVTQDRNQLIIEAGLGLGEAIVSGQITPDSYVLDKQWNFLEKHVNEQTKGLFRKNGGNEWRQVTGDKQKLTDKQIVELAKLVVKIEEHYRFPVDVEWAFDGQFWITQSRPITTLQEQPEQDFLTARNWEHYLTRPFTLFGASLWHKWYNSEDLEEAIGVRMADAMMVQEKPELVRCYRPAEQLSAFMENSRNLMQDKEKLKKVIERGFEVNKKAQSLIEGKESFSTIEEAVPFFVQLGVYGTVLPRTLLLFEDVADKELGPGMEKLRGVSYYPDILEKVIIPLAQEKLGASGKIVNQHTYEEVLEREKRAITKEKYVYTILNQKESITWVKDTKELFAKLEPQVSESDVIKGRPIYPGKVKGKVRLVDAVNYNKIPFNKGDILIAIDSNPSYMPLIKKAGAIVADEGGLGAHAVIISREFKKPCVIGTKIAMDVLKDGDIIEVDATNGTVRKL